MELTIHGSVPRSTNPRHCDQTPGEVQWRRELKQPSRLQSWLLEDPVYSSKEFVAHCERRRHTKTKTCHKSSWRPSTAG
ncbi:hypothetical protein J6590_035025 [Homalodisca vitripennis]|nr:hypothetical protein J6590_035025 [Homalodisca vitripennis]